MPPETKTLGILGGGQLGRMSALAAARLGIRVVIYTPEEDSPASQVAAKSIIAAYDDRKTLKSFANEVDVITYEFENVPCETVRYLQELKPVFPDDRLLEVAQDRVKEKTFLNGVGIPTARWAAVESPRQVENTLREWGAKEAIFKTTRFGYDGKGQARFAGDSDLAKALESFSKQPLIMEEIVDFNCEVSVIVARDRLGQLATYGPMLNEHRNHILYKTTVPAPVPESLSNQARKMTETLAEAVDLTGVLTLEMFVTRDGRILANEIAPRTHNSGHWTIDACACSQFEQHVRTVCGMNIGFPARHSDAVMVNLVGDNVKNAPKFLEVKNACLHLYGKAEARPGRKMGHVTYLKERDSSVSPLPQPENQS